MVPIRISETDLWAIAQTCWGESRNQGTPGIYAVATVLRNRHEFHPRWRGMPLVAICRSPYQFSAWNLNDPNLPQMRNVSLDDRVFCQCLIAAVEVMGGMVSSNVGRSTHYYVKDSPMPRWAKEHVPYCVIGAHIFFEGIA